MPRAVEHIETECHGSDGVLLGTALWKVQALHTAGAEGTYADAEFLGASFAQMDAWVTSNLADGKVVGLHICRHGIARCRSADASGTVCVHVDAFRSRAPHLIGEEWYKGEKESSPLVPFAKGLSFTGATPAAGAIVAVPAKTGEVEEPLVRVEKKREDPLAGKVQELRQRLLGARQELEDRLERRRELDNK